MKSEMMNGYGGASGGHALPRESCGAFPHPRDHASPSRRLYEPESLLKDGKVGRGRRTRRSVLNPAFIFLGLSAPAAAQEVDPASLSRLHDIVVPEAVPWWPPGPAWAVVGYLLVAVVLGLGIRAWRKWAANRYRRLALRELAEIERSLGADMAIEAIPALLKRTALMAYGRPAVASVSGEAWYRFLEGTSRPFGEARKPAEFFISSAYQPDAAVRLTTGEQAAIVHAARSWIRSHRVDAMDAKEGLNI